MITFYPIGKKYQSHPSNFEGIAFTILEKDKKQKSIEIKSPNQTVRTSINAKVLYNVNFTIKIKYNLVDD